jgi:quercetin dioxygenase-like cupin family protein
LFEVDAVQAKIITLEPGECVPPHHHSGATDHMFTIEGTLTVEFHNARETREFVAGQHCTVRPGIVHSTINRGKTTCRFLLVHTGKYDFHPEKAPA